MQTAMQELISQIKEEMTIDTIPKEWYYCLKSVVMSVEATYLEMEKQQIIQSYRDCNGLGHIYGFDGEEYYNETYGSKGSDEHIEHNLDEITTSSQTEISDEEIANEAKVWNLEDLISSQNSFICGAKWYREQLKKKQ